MDLLRKPRLAKMLRSPLWPPLVALVPAVIVTAMAVFGLGYHAIPFLDLEGPLRDTNIVTLLFWIVWLMGVIVTAPIVGRAWCGICPVGWMSDGLRRLGMNRPVPRILASFVPMALILFLVRLAVYRFHVNFFPDLTAALIIAFLLGAAAVALVFRGRAFCRWWCPIGGMLGVASRISPCGIGVRDAEVCRQCSGKECLSGREQRYVVSLPTGNREVVRRLRGCPVNLLPGDAARAKECLVCFQCHRNCPHDNVSFGFTSPRHRIGLPLEGTWETLFVLILAGSTLDIYLRVWPRAEELVFSPLLSLGRLSGWSTETLAVVGPFWSLALFPLLAIGAPLLLASFLARVEVVPSSQLLSPEPAEGERRAWTRRIHAFVVPLIPAVVAANTCLALVKMNARLAYLPAAAADPAGVTTLVAMQVKRTMTLPGSVVPLPILRWVVLGIVAAGIVSAWHTLREVAARGTTGIGKWAVGLLVAVPLGFVTVVMAGGLIAWLF